MSFFMLFRGGQKVTDAVRNNESFLQFNILFFSPCRFFKLHWIVHGLAGTQAIEKHFRFFYVIYENSSYIVGVLDQVK